MTHSRIFRLATTLILMALAANCFLKYLWWTACYSAWSGIPKMAAQWKAAGANASFNGWSFLTLEALGIAVLFSVIRLRRSAGFVTVVVRLTLSIVVTIAATGVIALVLSWMKQGIQ